MTIQFRKVGSRQEADPALALLLSATQVPTNTAEITPVQEAIEVDTATAILQDSLNPKPGQGSLIQQTLSADASCPPGIPAYLCGGQDGNWTGAVQSDPITIQVVDAERHLRDFPIYRDLFSFPEIRGTPYRQTNSALPQIIVGPLRGQGQTSTCWSHAFVAMWYSELVKTQPNANYPSRVWVVANTGQKACTVGNSAFAAATAFTVGMLPEGVLPEDKRAITDVMDAGCNYPGTIRGGVFIPNLSSINSPEHYAMASQYKSRSLITGFPKLFYAGTNECTKRQLIMASIQRGHAVTVMIGNSGQLNAYKKTLPDSVSTKNSSQDRPITDLSVLNPTNLHYLLFCGYAVVDNIPCFRAKNSWCVRSTSTNPLGPYCQWGDNVDRGFCWIAVSTARDWREVDTYDPRGTGDLFGGSAITTPFTPTGRPNASPPYAPPSVVPTPPVVPPPVIPPPVIPTPPVIPPPVIPTPPVTPGLVTQTPYTSFSVCGNNTSAGYNKNPTANKVVEYCANCRPCPVPAGYTIKCIGVCRGNPSCPPCQFKEDGSLNEGYRSSAPSFRKTV